jgi:hypothetical protein
MGTKIVTVTELIDKLKEFDPTLEVKLQQQDTHQFSMDSFIKIWDIHSDWEAGGKEIVAIL